MAATQRQSDRGIDFSNPALFNRAYIPLFKDKTRFLHLFGSAGSGKSVFGFQREIVKSFRPERRNRKTLVVRRYATTLFDSCYNELERRIESFNLTDYFAFLKSPMRITNRVTGVVFIFKGFDDEQKIKSITGVDRIIVEEATEIDSQSDIDQLSLRLRGFAETQITLMYNPVNVWHWLSQEVHNKLPGGHRLFHTTYRDNRWADKAFVDFLEGTKETNPAYWRIYGLGEWGQNLEGLVYPDFTVKADNDWTPQGYGVDFGYNAPTAIVECGIVDAPGQEKKTLRVRELLYETKHTSDSLIKRCEELGLDRRLPMICDNARPELIAALQKARYNALPCEKGAGSVKAGIDAVKTYALEIQAGSKNLLRETQSYTWKSKQGQILEEPQDGADHLLDGARYYVRHITVNAPRGPANFFGSSKRSTWR
jgi:phage terminase large subunit